MIFKSKSSRERRLKRIEEFQIENPGVNVSAMFAAHKHCHGVWESPPSHIWHHVQRCTSCRAEYARRRRVIVDIPIMYITEDEMGTFGNVEAFREVFGRGAKVRLTHHALRKAASYGFEGGPDLSHWFVRYGFPDLEQEYEERVASLREQRDLERKREHEILYGELRLQPDTPPRMQTLRLRRERDRRFLLRQTAIMWELIKRASLEAVR